MNWESKIRALRALAERPGTPAEGQLAREMLARLLERHPEADSFDDDWTFPHERYRRHEPPPPPPPPPPVFRTCPCGKVYSKRRCSSAKVHKNIRELIAQEFQVWDRVEIGPEHIKATVRSYSGCKWNQIRVQLDNGERIEFAIYLGGWVPFVNFSRIERERRAKEQAESAEARKTAATTRASQGLRELRSKLTICWNHRVFLSAWEESFVAGLIAWLDEHGRLTPRQIEVFESIWKLRRSGSE